MVKILKFDNEEDWMDARLTRVTGTRKIMPKRGTAKLDGFYDLIGERLLKQGYGKSSFQIGTEREPEAIERFEKETGKEVDSTKQLFTREDNDYISISPDGGKIKGEKSSLEIKCFSVGKHIKAFLTKEMPSEYEHQKLQYFVVDDELEKLYVGFYNPDLYVHDFFYLTFTREELKFEIAEYLEFQRKTLEEIDKIEEKLIT